MLAIIHIVMVIRHIIFCHIFQATVLEEMPPFPERESSILAKLKKRQPDKTKGKILEKENKTDMERPTPNASVTNDATNGIQVSEPSAAISL